MIERDGDMFTSDAGTFAHGVNARGVMGAGVARVFRERYPEMFEEYEFACEGGFDLGMVQKWVDTDGTIVLNMCTQFNPGPEAMLWAVHATAVTALHLAANEERDRIAIPRIGCGIGGLEWDRVRELLVDAEKSVGRLRLVKPEFEVWSL